MRASKALKCSLPRLARIFTYEGMNAPLIDPFARAITYLRVSVTDRCDFRCVYCMSENMTFLPKKELLTLEELDRMCSTFVDLGVQKAAHHRAANLWCGAAS